MAVRTHLTLKLRSTAGMSFTDRYPTTITVTFYLVQFFSFLLYSTSIHRIVESYCNDASLCKASAYSGTTNHVFISLAYIFISTSSPLALVRSPKSSDSRCESFNPVRDFKNSFDSWQQTFLASEQFPFTDIPWFLNILSYYPLALSVTDDYFATRRPDDYNRADEP